MLSYTKEEILKDIKQFTGLDLDVKITHDVLFLDKYSDLYTELEISSIKELERINKNYFDTCIFFPEGTEIPEGYELLFYECFENENGLKYILSEKYEKFNDDNINKIITKFKSVEFKSHQAMLFNMKDRFRAGFSQDFNKVN